MENPYVRLTQEFNHGLLRAILASGQAVVLYRLAIMSKDGDWIVKEEAEARRSSGCSTRSVDPSSGRTKSVSIATFLPPPGGERNGRVCRRRWPADRWPKPMRSWQ
jgi:hypothetical protein